MNKKHVILAVVFVVAHLALRVLASSDSDVLALAASNYQPATDAEIAAALADEPIVCVAADTESGCR